MVETIKKDGSELYVCEECGFTYAEREWAEKCQAWCAEHKSCNLDIITHALEQG
ncbi:MAG TPA: hypothetical protein VGA53_01115 [Candidatus Paceibacterota bacterium]